MNRRYKCVLCSRGKMVNFLWSCPSEHQSVYLHLCASTDLYRTMSLPIDTLPYVDGGSNGPHMGHIIYIRIKNDFSERIWCIRMHILKIPKFWYRRRHMRVNPARIQKNALPSDDQKKNTRIESYLIFISQLLRLKNQKIPGNKEIASGGELKRWLVCNERDFRWLGHCGRKTWSLLVRKTLIEYLVFIWFKRRVFSGRWRPCLCCCCCRCWSISVSLASRQASRRRKRILDVSNSF